MSLLQWARRAAAATSGRDEKLEIMSRTPMFSRCTHRELMELGSTFELSFVHPGELLQRRGTRCRWWTLVAEGTALAFDGDDPVGLPQWWVSLLNAGDSWGDDATVRDEPCEISITALTPMALLVTDSRNYRWIVERFDCLGRRPNEGRKALSPSVSPSVSRALVLRSGELQSSEAGAGVGAGAGESLSVRVSRS